MASTFSPSLRIELIGDGDQSGIWGQTTNNNLGSLIEQAIAGVVTITMTDANYTLTNFNGVSDEARNQVIVATGTNAAVRDIIIPLVEKTYIVRNDTTGGFGVRIIGSSGSGVTIPNGITTVVYCDGVNVFTTNNGSTGNFAVNGNLTATGTANITGALTATTATFSGAISSVSPTFTGTPVAPTASVSTDNTQIATTAFVRDIIPTGIISMWSGSIASIPSGWALCDGTNGTPDLRNRFIVGAGSTYAVNATGGSADAIVVSHTHTGTTNNAGTHVHGGAIAPFIGFTPDGFGNASTTGGARTLQDMASAGDHNHTFTTASSGSSGTNANLPPYFALAYIMKL